jgi:hypothetical protein
LIAPPGTKGLEEETEDENERHNRFFLGKISKPPAFNKRRGQLVFTLTRLKAFTSTTGTMWKEGDVKDEVTTFSLLGMVTASKTAYVSKSKSFYIINWLNPRSIAFAPIKR